MSGYTWYEDVKRGESTCKFGEPESKDSTKGGDSGDLYARGSFAVMLAR